MLELLHPVYDPSLFTDQDHGLICLICQQPHHWYSPDKFFSGSIPFHWHHLVPLSRGGPDTETNKVPLCVPCHYWLHREASAQEHLLSRNLSPVEWMIFPVQLRARAILGEFKPYEH